MAAGTSFPVAGGMPVICIPLIETRQYTADIAVGAGAMVTVPFKCRVVAIVGNAGIQGGTTPFTDVDLDVQKNTTSLLSAVIPAVNSSTAVAGGLAGTLVTTEATLTLAAGDVLKLGIDITGGSSPTGNGARADVYVVPLN